MTTATYDPWAGWACWICRSDEDGCPKVYACEHVVNCDTDVETPMRQDSFDDIPVHECDDSKCVVFQICGDCWSNLPCDPDLVDRALKAYAEAACKLCGPNPCTCLPRSVSAPAASSSSDTPKGDR